MQYWTREAFYKLIGEAPLLQHLFFVLKLSKGSSAILVLDSAIFTLNFNTKRKFCESVASPIESVWKGERKEESHDSWEGIFGKNWFITLMQDRIPRVSDTIEVKTFISVLTDVC